jgi:hypothetical protein
MKKLIFFVAVLSVFFLNSCVGDSDWGKVVIPSNQKIVFSPSSDELFENEKNVFVKFGKNEMYITNRNLVNRICYLKLAFPEKDILIQYVKIEEEGKIKLDPRFIN